VFVTRGGAIWAPTELPTVHKILLVDDDDAVRNMMTVTLEHKGFNVVSAASVTDALRHIATESFDVLITDLHMPNPGATDLQLLPQCGIPNPMR